MAESSDQLQIVERLASILSSLVQPSPDQADVELLTREQTARLLGVGLTTLDGLDRRGEIPEAIRIGGDRNVRWSRSELLAWIRAGCPPRARWTAKWRHFNRAG